MLAPLLSASAVKAPSSGVSRSFDIAGLSESDANASSSGRTSAEQGMQGHARPARPSLAICDFAAHWRTTASSSGRLRPLRRRLPKRRTAVRDLRLERLRFRTRESPGFGPLVGRACYRAPCSPGQPEICMLLQGFPDVLVFPLQVVLQPGAGHCLPQGRALSLQKPPMSRPRLLRPWIPAACPTTDLCTLCSCKAPGACSAFHILVTDPASPSLQGTCTPETWTGHKPDRQFTRANREALQGEVDPSACLAGVQRRQVVSNAELLPQP